MAQQVFPDPYSIIEWARLLAGPILTAALAFLGVLAGAWISRRTTADSLVEQAARERLKLIEDARLKRGEILRDKVEQLVELMNAVYVNSKAWSAQTRAIADALDSNGAMPVALDQTLTLEQERAGNIALFYFPDSRRAFDTAVDTFHASDLSDMDDAARLLTSPKDEELRKQIVEATYQRDASRAQVMDGLMTKLREELQETMP